MYKELIKNYSISHNFEYKENAWSDTTTISFQHYSKDEFKEMMLDVYDTSCVEYLLETASTIPNLDISDGVVYIDSVEGCLTYDAIYEFLTMAHNVYNNPIILARLTRKEDIDIIERLDWFNNVSDIYGFDASYFIYTGMDDKTFNKNANLIATKMHQNAINFANIFISILNGEKNSNASD